MFKYYEFNAAVIKINQRSSRTMFYLSRYARRPQAPNAYRTTSSITVTQWGMCGVVVGGLGVVENISGIRT